MSGGGGDAGDGVFCMLWVVGFLTILGVVLGVWLS